VPRKKKQEIKVNNNDSLEGLIQETYNDACLQISDTQRVINELSTSIPSAPSEEVDVNDLASITREKSNLLKVKDSAIRIKLEIAKLQSDIIKNRGNVEETLSETSGGKATLDDFSSVREMLKKNKNSEENQDLF
jgi:hypothetical protein